MLTGYMIPCTAHHYYAILQTSNMAKTPSTGRLPIKRQLLSYQVQLLNDVCSFFYLFGMRRDCGERRKMVIIGQTPQNMNRGQRQHP